MKGRGGEILIFLLAAWLLFSNFMLRRNVADLQKMLRNGSDSCAETIMHH